MNQSNTFDDVLNGLAQRFEWHAKNIYGAPSINSSPLYEVLSLHVAKDPEVLALVKNADLSQQVSNLLFGAVHFLLLSGASTPLREFYPNLSQNPHSRHEIYPYFRAFCLEHAELIRQLVTTRRVQTNEVQRCTAWVPAFELIARRLNYRRPLALVEIGSSAGLNLLWDQYGYDYGEAGSVGNRESGVQLACVPQGDIRPPLSSTFPPIVDRTGIDLYPVDVDDQESVRWLRALIWPEHTDRIALLEQAIQIARLHQAKIVAGDAIDVLRDVLSSAPSDAVLCVYHSYTLNQCSKVTREKILDILANFAQDRDFFRLSLEWYSGQKQPHLELFPYRNGQMQSELLAYCESHGRMIEWLQL